MKLVMVISLLAATVSAAPAPQPTPVRKAQANSSLSFFNSFYFNPPFGNTCSVTNSTQPGIPSKSTAQSYLNSLTIAASYDDGNYDRDLFPHWNTVSGTCNTRYVTVVVKVVGQ